MADIVNVEEVVGTLHAGIEASQTVPAVLDFAKKEMQEQRSYSERLIARFMGKGRKPISDPDGDGDDDTIPALDTDHDGGQAPLFKGTACPNCGHRQMLHENHPHHGKPDGDLAKGMSCGRCGVKGLEPIMHSPDRGARGEGMSLKGTTCKGCGHAIHMSKGHPHFGAKRQVAEELAKGMRCPRCGDSSVSPIMDKGDDELPPPMPMDKGEEHIAHPEVDRIFQRLGGGVDAIEIAAASMPLVLEALKGLEERLDAQDDTRAMLKGDEERNATLIAIQERLDRIEEFQGAHLEVLEGFATEQEAIKGAVEMWSPGAKSETHEESALDRAADAIRKPQVTAPMAKGEEDAITEDELNTGISRGVITHADAAMYRAGREMNSYGRDVKLFRRAIN